MKKSVIRLIWFLAHVYRILAPVGFTACGVMDCILTGSNLSDIRCPSAVVLNCSSINALRAQHAVLCDKIFECSLCQLEVNYDSEKPDLTATVQSCGSREVSCNHVNQWIRQFITNVLLVAVQNIPSWNTPSWNTETFFAPTGCYNIKSPNSAGTC